MTYPWGDEFSYDKLNIWEEDKDELAKLEEKRTKAIVGEPEIDVESFDNPIMAIDENKNEDIHKYMKAMEMAENGKLPDEDDE